MLLAEYLLATAGAFGVIGVLAMALGALWPRDPFDVSVERDDAAG